MQIVVHKEALLASLDKVAAVVQGKTELKGLSLTYLKPVAHDTFLLQAMNSKSTISTSVRGATITDAQPIAIQSHLLRDIVKYAPKDDIKLTVKDQQIYIQSGMSRYKLPVERSAELELPDLGQFHPETESVAYLENISEVFSAVSYCLSREADLAYQNGMIVMGANAYATNRLQLACHTQDMFKPKSTAIIPTEYLETVQKIFKKKGEDINIRFSDNRIVMQDCDTTYFGMLIETKVPAIEGLLQERNYSHTITLERTDLLMALRRVCLVSDKEKKVEIKFSDNQCHLKAGIGNSISLDTIPCDISGGEQTVLLNASYLAATTEAVHDSVVTMLFYHDRDYVTLKGDKCTHLIMPLRY